MHIDPGRSSVVSRSTLQSDTGQRFVSKCVGLGRHDRQRSPAAEFDPTYVIEVKGASDKIEGDLPDSLLIRLRFQILARRIAIARISKAERKGLIR